ncbi:MAG: hypothetical protein OP8BY_0339 [Candidatus Saccharicenans subterraneus]|uniref:Uncharacterized protein n=1 Tax=Candidatus Saccharicenans subterraneus TaxID=2508984 RepID=A0A3E2BL13_9BACT|nr:MAG: hypothetical protein OP8BY_0339 [Candidatus Saccharicenans subterraneum]
MACRSLLFSHFIPPPAGKVKPYRQAAEILESTSAVNPEIDYFYFIWYRKLLFGGRK